MDSAYYLQYVEAIDESGREVSEWEAEFIESLLKHRPYALTERQQAVISRMARKYLGEEIA